MKRLHWIACAVLTAGCRLLDPDYQAITMDKSIHLVDDTENIRDLFAAEEKRDEKVEQFLREKHAQEKGSSWVWDVMVHPDRYAPGRKEFLEAMARAPGITIPEKTYCRILVASKAHCHTGVFGKSVYVKVRITIGPYRGREGWGCEGEIQYANGPL